MSAAAHEGKLVVIATDADGHLWYTVKQDGFEDSYLDADPAKRTGWEDWLAVELPDEDADASVVDRERATLTRQDAPDTYLVRSVYRSRDLGSPAPAQLVSGGGHLYVFRQSTSGTLLVDRFVLDGMTNKLGRKLEVRFKRSRQRHTPYGGGRRGTPASDSLDYRDTDGALFFEPTTELCLITGVAGGRFAVVRVATAEHDKHRWHIFTADPARNQIELVTIRASDDGLFDLRDYTVFDPAPGRDQPTVPRSIPGVLRRAFDVPGAVVTGGPAATRYDLQQEQLIGSGPATQLIRGDTRLMLAVPTDHGTATLAFGIATDGTLSELAPAATTTTLRADERDLLLPLDTLDQLRAVGDVTPPPHGTIEAMEMGAAADRAEGKVVVSSAQALELKSGDTVDIRGTTHYNGQYQVSDVYAESFTIDAQFVDSEIGVWEKREDEQAGLVFDGMVVSYHKTEDGKLRVTAPNHGLVDGDQVQLEGTSAYNGAYPVTKIDEVTFAINRRWAAGEAVNVRLEALKRRGLLFDGIDDYVDLPVEAYPATGAITICLWAYGDDSLPTDKGAVVVDARDDHNRRVAAIHLPAKSSRVYFDCGSGDAGCDRVGAAAEPDEFKGSWTHWAVTKDVAAGTMKIFRNGALWAEGARSRPIGAATWLRLGALPASNRKPSRYYAGAVSDLAIYDRALDADEIRAGMYVTRTGQESGLMAYWRLGAVVEGPQRTVIDLGPGALDGVVWGGACAGAVTCRRTLADGATLAVKYTNDELVAVTQRATYVEELEFRAIAGGLPLTGAAVADADADADGTGRPIFALRHWGKRSRGADDVIELSPQPPTEPFVEVGDGWLRASCRFTIPDGMALLRSFEIADVRGTWDTLEIRKHGMRLVSEAITESAAEASPAVVTLADDTATLDAQLDQIAADEQREAELLVDKLALEAKLALLADLEFVQREHDAAELEVGVLFGDALALEQEYDDAVANPLNYYCTLVRAGTTKEFLHRESKTARAVVWESGHEWEFVPEGDGYYIRLRNPDNQGRYLYLLEAIVGELHAIRTEGTNWKKLVWRARSKDGGYTLQDTSSGRYLRRESGPHPLSTGGGAHLVLSDTPHVWNLTAGDQVGTVIDDARRRWEAKQQQLEATQQRLTELEALLGFDVSDLKALKDQLDAVIQELIAVQTRLSADSAAYLGSVRSLQRGPLSMPEVATDSRGLTTNAAVLPFARPASRVTLRETCEGDVELAYLDADGRMRLTRYDAAADSRNATFEEWVTDAGRACLRQAAPGVAATLAEAVDVGRAWSAEAWVRAPLPTWEWVVLAGSEDGDDGLIVSRAGADLGVRSQGRFFACGCELGALTPGWHHIAAAKRGDGADASVSFYVDGAPVGQPVSPRFTAASLDGVDDWVELPAESIPSGAAITVALWARTNASAAPGREAVLLEAVDDQGRRVLGVDMLSGDGTIRFECGVDSAGADRLEWTPQDAEHRGGWTHWAFTKHSAAGLMRVYRNGRLWQRATDMKKPLVAPTLAVVGKAAADRAFLFGDIADVCVWDRELTAVEIQRVMGRTPAAEADKDDHLSGLWRFERDADRLIARDYSFPGVDKTLPAGVAVTETTAPAQVAIVNLGESASLAVPGPSGASASSPQPAPAPAVTWEPAGAVALDGVDGHVELPALTLDTAQGLTIEAWVRYDAFLESARIIDWGNGPDADNLVLTCAPTTNRPRFYVLRGSSSSFIEAPAALTAGVWTHVAATVDAAGNAHLYLDGQLAASGAIHAPDGVTRGRCYLGRSNGPSDAYFKGALADVRVWSRVRAEAEILAGINRRLSGDEPGLTALWAFSMVAAVDLSPARRDGLYAGGAALAAADAPPLPALVLDGVDDHVVLPALGDEFAQGFSVEVWVHYNAFRSWSRIVEFGNGEAADNIILSNRQTSNTLVLSVYQGATPSSIRALDVLKLRAWTHVAATVDAAGNAAIYIDGERAATGTCLPPSGVARTSNFAGWSNWSGRQLAGKLADLRVWGRVRTPDEVQASMREPLSGDEPGLVGWWTFGSAQAIDGAAGGRHGAYVGGPAVGWASVPVGVRPPTAPAPDQVTAAIGSSPPLELSELRIWNTALDDDEVAVNSVTLLSGNEPGLAAYLPMDEATGVDIRDRTGYFHGQVRAAVRWACAAPIGRLDGATDGVVSAEYSAVIVNPDTRQKTSIMRRFFGAIAPGGVLVLPDKRVEELDLLWVGNAQFAPTLLGYIEGAPPIPSENLTESSSYNGATAVELVTSEDLEFRWNRSEDLGDGVSLDAFLGVDNQTLGGFGVMSKVVEARVGARIHLDQTETARTETNITTRASNRMTDRLELRGTPEQTAKFPHLGRRFVPKNVGYALVISGTADVFVSRLRRSGRMVGYQVTPVEGIPPDVNTVTFLMNPAYVMQGSLDGLTGTRATSDRFYRHVPAMRAQLGAMYPASYYRIQEAYALERKIENEDKRRESFFAQFSASGQVATMDRQLGGGGSHDIEFVEAQEGDDGSQIDELREKGEESAKAQKAEVERKQAMIDAVFSDFSRRAHARTSFEAWQKKMERLQVLAGKRNIVNTYVWDADGGLRTETQSFASTAEHTIGGGFSMDASRGVEGGLGVLVFKAELTANANLSLTQTMNKTQTTTTGIELNVDLYGVEATGITDHDDLPIVPGEKVDRYRFMTFYLEGSTDNFSDFWTKVVDPEWLRGNGEEARTLRQAMGKANRTWRVLHRVTYVERPALAGFGRDPRMDDTTVGDVVASYLQTLTNHQLALQSEMEEIRRIVQQIQAKIGS